MEPMSPASAALLRLESDGSPMHAGWVARLDAGAVDLAALRARVARRLRAPAAARFRRIAGRAGADAGGHGSDGRRSPAPGEPAWIDDRAFAVERHVAAWPAPLGDAERLSAALDRVLAEPLPRDRPLWRVVVLPPARGGRGGAAVVALAHRALVEGLEAGALRELVFDRGPAPAAGPREAPAPLGGGDPALEELRSLRRIGALDATRAGGAARARLGVRSAPSARPGGGGGAASARLGSTLRRAAMARMEGLTAAPRSFLDAAPAGARRTLVTARLELGRLDGIARRTGTDPHDVELAVLAGALRRMALAGAGAPAPLRALVPVDAAGEQLLGDGTSAVVTLPADEPDAAARLARIHAAMAAARGGPAAAGAPAERTPTLLAGPPEELATRLAIGARLCNLTVLRTRGPRQALQLGGVRVRALHPVTPMPEEHALAVSALAYGRHLHLAATVDPSAVGQVTRLPALLGAALDELDAATEEPAAGQVA